MKKNKSNQTIIDKNTKSDEHMIHLEHQVEKNFDEHYNYYIKNPIAKFMSLLVWVFAVSVLRMLIKLKHGMKFENLKTIKALKKSGKGWISVSNHNLILDCCAGVRVNLWRKTYIPTVEETMKIPGVRHILKAVNVIPIPTNPKGLVKFKNSINELLSNDKVLHFYPEGALWPYYNKLRPFKPGAFRFARENNVPIVPICIHFRPRKGLWKILGKHPLVTVKVLEPIYPDMDIPNKKSIAKLSAETFSRMNEIIESNYFETADYFFMNDDEMIANGIIQKPSITSNNNEKLDSHDDNIAESVAPTEIIASSFDNSTTL